MLKFLILSSLVVLSASFSYSQATLFSDDFESGNNWTVIGDNTPNKWQFGTCAGNGTTLTGTLSVYISSGPANGTVAGCGPTGLEQYGYENAPTSQVNSTIIHHTVDATCASNLQLTFDYQISGNTGSDFGEAVYSTDGGTTWIVIGGELSSMASWGNTTLSLPAPLDGTSFEIGYRFTYDDNASTNQPLAIDNVTISGTDTTPPSITCPSDASLSVNSICQAVVPDYKNAIVALSDNCTDSASITITQSPIAGTILAGSPGTSDMITLTATDEAGNATSCSFTVNIEDNSNPTATCPPDTSEYVDINCEFSIPDYSSAVMTTDNCTASGSISYTQTPPVGTIITGAMIDTPIMMTASDESGNSASCQFIMRTLDTLATSITCPADSNLIVDSNCEFILGDYTSEAILMDNCLDESLLTVTQSPLPGTTITSDQVITLTVTGGTPATPQTCTFNGILVDTISPTIICPLGSNLYVDNSCLAALPDYTTTTLVNDNCPSAVTFTQTPAAGTTVGANPNQPITITVFDADGNSGTCSFTVPVLDTIAPNAVCPSDQSISTDVNCTGIIGDYVALVTPTDNCSSVGNISITQSPASGMVISTDQLITMTITDENGNTGTCSFNALLIDNLPPTITCPADQSVSTDTGCSYTLADFTNSPTVLDNCSSGTGITISQSPVQGTVLPVGTTTITLTATDEALNSASCTFDIIVSDATAPIISVCAPTQIVYSDATCNGTLGDYTALLTANDNCSSVGNLTITQSPAIGTSISTTTLVTLTVTDENNNASTCSFNAVLSDTIPPVVTCPNDLTVGIDASCQYTVPNLVGSVTGTDNCSSLANMTITQNPTAGSTASGITPVLITLTDEAGNSTTCISSLIPDDSQAPTIVCPTPPVQDIGSSCDYVLPNYGSMALVTDNCSNFTINQTPAPGDIINPGMNTIQLEVIDAGGNSASCTFIQEVIENVSPTINCPNDTVSCIPTVFYTEPTFSDNCFAYLTQTDGTGLTSGSTFPIGITDLQYTVSDSSGNTQACMFRVEILEFPSDASILEDSLFYCDANSALLEATPATTGTGSWNLLSGQGTINNPAANVSGVNSLGFGTSVFEWSISTASCGTNADTLVIVNSQQPLSTNIPQDTIYACDASAISLEATAVIYGTGNWSSDGDAIINSPNSNITTVDFQSNGWQQFTWIVSNPGCPSTMDSVMVLSTQSTSASISDSILCLEDGSVSVVSDSLLPNQSAEWIFIQGGGDIQSPYSHTTEISNLDNGLNQIVYTLDHPFCPSVSDTVEVMVSLCNPYDPVLPTLITPNFDGKNDLFIVDYLDQLFPTCHVVIFNRWGGIVFESVGYDDPWDGTVNGEKLPMGTYFYRIELNDGSGESFTGDISIIH